MLLGQFIVRTRKIALEHFLNCPNRTNFETRKNAEIAGHSVKYSRFRPSKRQSSGIYQNIYLTFCARINLTGFFHSLFLEIGKLSRFFKIIYVDYYNFQI